MEDGGLPEEDEQYQQLEGEEIDMVSCFEGSLSLSLDRRSPAGFLQEDAWSVVSAYFEEKGLVMQQLNSYDDFMQETIGSIVCALPLPPFPYA